MKLQFYKYHGAGNDFVLFDARQNEVKEALDALSKAQLEMLCHRRFGVGADGVMFLESPENGYDFKMRYFNSDGGESTMCGNGGRCIVRFAEDLGIGATLKRFTAIDGEHSAEILEDGNIALGMVSVDRVHSVEEGWFLDTGSPHLVLIDEPYDTKEAVMMRRKYDANVNFMLLANGKEEVRTYERGVEDETWACGTGTTAAAIVRSIYESHDDGECQYSFSVRGGELRVNFLKQGNSNFTNLILTGPSKQVFIGEYNF